MNEKMSELIARLEALTPMPDDDSPELTASRLAEYEAVIGQIEAVARQTHPLDPRLIEPLIASFGYGDAFGLYWATLHLLEEFPSELLRPALCAALQTGKPGARMWCAYMLGVQRNRHDVPVLVRALHDPMSEVRYYALMALAMIGDASATVEMKNLLHDPARKVQKAARKYIDELVALERF